MLSFPNFFEKKLDKKLYLLHTQRNEFLTYGTLLSFIYNKHSTSMYSSKTKFCIKVLCFLSFKKGSSQTLTSFLKKACPKTLFFAYRTKQIFNRWCSVVVPLKQLLKYNIQQQNGVLHKSSLLPFFQERKFLNPYKLFEKSLPKNFIFCIQNKF